MSEQPADPNPATVDPAQVLADSETAARQAASDAVAGVESTVHTVGADLHPAVAEVLQFFDHDHLPAELSAVSAPFKELAQRLAATLRGSQLTLALHHLLAAKDSAVRAQVAASKSAS